MSRFSNGDFSGIPYSASFAASPAPEPEPMFLIYGYIYNLDLYRDQKNYEYTVYGP